MFGHIILRDIPKEQVQLDLLVYEIAGGFRGFAMVPPGAHYVNVKKNDAMQAGFWCVVPEEGVVIRVFDHDTGTFKEDTPENVKTYTELALGGAMNKSLIPVLARSPVDAEAWTSLTRHLTLQAFPPALHDEQPMVPPAAAEGRDLGQWFEQSFKSRFEQAFLGTHKGNINAFLAEFEHAYLQMLLGNDEAAGKRWRHLLLAVFNAGEHAMRASPDVFPPLVDVIVTQLIYMPDEFFDAGAIGSQGQYMVEDLCDTGIVELAYKGDLLGTILADRKAPMQG
ncbi:MAG: hypothetical protein GYA24_21800 [Candidatus Lokiarchaeota archaeon]|nr:hypothetical protein [Candidatus Lokiarchaeota archaeon]